jgi:hypothetical protein
VLAAVQRAVTPTGLKLERDPARFIPKRRIQTAP